MTIGGHAISTQLRIAICVASIVVAASFPNRASAAPQQLVTTHNPAVSLPAGGNGDSVAPVLSGDGRFVVFTSAANNLVAGDNSFLRSDVFLRDRLLGTTTLISINASGTGGGNGNSSGGVISSDGRYVAFESDATDLVANDNNGKTDIFLRDTLAGVTTLVSVSTNGGVGDGASTYPVMTPDGRYIAFLSFVSNLTTNDTNGIQNVFVRDTLSGTTTLVSTGSTGPITPGATVVDTPVITPDGRYVAFFSTSQNLVTNKTLFPGDIYIRDLVGGTTSCISTNVPNAATMQNYPSTHPVLSDDGRFCSFKNNGTNSNPAVVYRYDSTTQTNTVVSTNGFVVPPNDDDTYGPEITPNGRFVAYVTADSNLHLWDGLSNTDTIVSLDRFGATPTNGLSKSPALSTDGKFVAFTSTAINTVTNALSDGTHLYLRDVQGGVTTLVDVDTNGAGSVGLLGVSPALSTNGQFIAFTSPDGNLVSADNNKFLDVFLRKMTNGITELVSLRNANLGTLSASGASTMTQPSLTPDGRWMVFASRAEDLVTNDFNGNQNVFVADLQTGSNILVSVGLDGNSAQGGDSTMPAISADGRFVAFVSLATNLVVTNLTNTAANIFLRDLQSGTTKLVNVDSNGALLGNGDSFLPAISQDGRVVTFYSLTNRALPQVTGIFWRDTLSNRTAMLPIGTTSARRPPSISANGHRVAYIDPGFPAHTWVWDSVLSSNIYSNNFSGVPTLSPSGSKLMISGGSILFSVLVADVDASSNIASFSNSRFVEGSPIVNAWSADERFIAFMLPYLSSGQSFGTNNVFLADLLAGTMTLVSATASRVGPANNHSDSPSLSRDGRFLTYRSFATDIMPGINSTPNIYVFDRLTGSNTLLTAQQTVPAGWTYWMAGPTISTNGGTVVFQSHAPSQVPGVSDRNFGPDVFAMPQSPWPTNDSVGDGIPDAWRALYFGGDGKSTNSQSCATCDPDGDGMSNSQEYIAGTNPINATSVFRLQLFVQITPSGEVFLNWPASPGRSYQVQFKNNLTDPVWQSPFGNPWILGTTGTFSAPLTATGYYRVVITE